MATWICASCGAKHDANNPPCTRCAGEQFAKLPEDAESPGRVERDVSVEWRCKACGHDHIKNNPPCEECGHLQFEPIYLSQTGESTESIGGDPAPGSEPQRRVTLTLILTYLFAVFAIVVGAVNLLIGNFWGGSAVLLSGVVAAPRTRTRVEAALGVSFSRGAVIGVVAILYVTGNLLSIPYL